MNTSIPVAKTFRSVAVLGAALVLTQALSAAPQSLESPSDSAGALKEFATHLSAKPSPADSLRTAIEAVPSLKQNSIVSMTNGKHQRIEGASGTSETECLIVVDSHVLDRNPQTARLSGIRRDGTSSWSFCADERQPKIIVEGVEFDPKALTSPEGTVNLPEQVSVTPLAALRWVDADGLQLPDDARAREIPALVATTQRAIAATANCTTEVLTSMRGGRIESIHLGGGSRVHVSCDRRFQSLNFAASGLDGMEGYSVEWNEKLKTFLLRGETATYAFATTSDGRVQHYQKVAAGERYDIWWDEAGQVTKTWSGPVQSAPSAPLQLGDVKVPGHAGATYDAQGNEIAPAPPHPSAATATRDAIAGIHPSPSAN